MRITREDVERLAKLSRIDLSEEEAESMIHDLEHILAYFEELKDVSFDGALRGTSAFEENIARRDNNPPVTGASPEKLTSAFPEKKDGFLKIPPVFEKQQ